MDMWIWTAAGQQPNNTNTVDYRVPGTINNHFLVVDHSAVKYEHHLDGKSTSDCRHFDIHVHSAFGGSG